MNRVYRGIAALSLLGVISCTKAPPSGGGDDQPEVHRWLAKDRTHLCEVRAAYGKVVPCSEFSKERLDEFRVIYSDPYRKVSAKKR